MSTSEDNWGSIDPMHGQADQVSSQYLVGSLKCLLVISTLTHSITNNSIAIAYEEQDTSCISSVECSYISDTIRVYEEQFELWRIEALSFIRCEESLRAGNSVLRFLSYLIITHIKSLIPVSFLLTYCLLSLVWQIEVSL